MVKSRRTALRLAGGTLVTALGGCATTPVSNSPADNPTSERSPTTSPTDSPEDSTPTNADKTPSSYDLPYRFRIQNRAEQRITVNVRLSKLNDKGESESEATEKSYEIDSGRRVSLDEHIAPSTAYNIAVSVDGGVSEDWDLYPYVYMTVELLSKTELDITRAEV